MNIELGGIKKSKGWVVVNSDPNVYKDINHDLSRFPYPFEDNSAERIMMIHTLEHFPNTICKRIMAEIYRIAKAECLVMIQVPYWKKDMWTNPEHQMYFKPDWFRSLNPKSKKYRNMEHWCPYNFQIYSMKWITGKHAFWRKYSLEVVLIAKKIVLRVTE